MEIRYDSINPEGKRKQHRERFHGTKPQADKYLVEVQAKINRGEYNDLGNITLREFLEKWIDEYCKPNLVYKTFCSYKTTIKKYISKNMGGTRLTNLKPAQIQSYYNLMAVSKKEGGPGLASTSILYHHRILHEALKHSVNLGYINYNPTDRVKPPRKNKPEIKSLSREQAQYILDTYREHKIFMPILLAVYTGARQGEICGLCWSDIDLNSGNISIYHSLQRQEGILVLKKPKSKGSRRSIPIPLEVIAELKRIKVQQAENKLAMGMGYDQRGFVCAWEDGRPFDPDWVSKQWRRLVQTDIKKTDEQKVDRNIPEGTRFHDLRHTHATLLLSQGVSIKVVQERLGHESITTTGDIYSHVSPAMQEHAVKILDSMFDISR